MFNAMMDPEIMRLAQEQMSKIPPAELAKLQQQMLSNPELMKFATESMKNLRPEDVKLAAEQLKHTKHEDIAELTEKMANASPEELTTLTARAEAQFAYQLSATEMLKKQGNELHSNRQYREAADKYLRAKDNLKSIPSAKSSTLRLQCSLNLMSCYLKTMQYEDCIKEGSEVLKHDLKNVKGLYRRGQAYKEIGKLEDAVADFNKAHKFSPEDETIADVLKDTKEMLLKDRGVVIEEIEEQTISVPLSCHNTVECSSTQSIEGSESKQNCRYCSAISTDKPEACFTESYSGASPVGPEALRTFNENPDSIRLFQKYVSNADSEVLSAMGLGGMSPDVIKTATEMIGSMKAEELQKMLEVASSLKTNGLTSTMNGHNMTPELVKTASDKISSMSPEELSKMYEFSSSFNANNMKANSVSKVQRSERSYQASVPATVSTSAGTSDTRMPPSSTSDLQETMRNSMKDPAMHQMFTSMMKNMSPEMMANMGEQFGMKLSKEDAARAQHAMASLSPSDLDRMMLWAERAQKGMDTVKKTKNWLLGRPGMILAIFVLILAIILHRLGYIGS